MKVVIVIDGKSADELFAVGPNDLRDTFLPEGLNVNPDDVVRIHFEELTRDGKVISVGEALLGDGPYMKCNHSENFERE